MTALAVAVAASGGSDNTVVGLFALAAVLFLIAAWGSSGGKDGES